MFTSNNIIDFQLDRDTEQQNQFNYSYNNDAIYDHSDEKTALMVLDSTLIFMKLE